MAGWTYRDTVDEQFAAGVLEGLPEAQDPAPVPPDNPFADTIDDTAPELRTGPRPGLLERFEINRQAGERNTILGAARDYQQSTLPPEWREGVGHESRARFNERYDSFPQFNSLLEAGAALTGQLVGGGAAPENFIPIGLGTKLLGMAGISLSTIRARIFAGAVDAGVTNAVADAAVQGLELAGGSRKEFSLGQLAASTAIGAAIGGAAGPLTHRIRDPGGPDDGMAVRIAEDQAKVPAGMLRTVTPDGSEKIIGDRLLDPIEPDPNIAKTEAVADELKAIPGADGLAESPAAKPVRPARRAKKSPEAAPAAPEAIPGDVPKAEPPALGDRLAVEADRKAGRQTAEMADADVQQSVEVPRALDPELRTFVDDAPDDATRRSRETAFADTTEDVAEIGPLGPVLVGYEGNFAAAHARLEALQGGEARAVFQRPDVGPIDLVWGFYDPKTDEGLGLAKIVGKHPDVVKRLPELIETLPVESRSANRIILSDDLHRATIRLDFDKAEKTWLMTAYVRDQRRRGGGTTGRPAGHQEDTKPSSSSPTDPDIALRASKIEGDAIPGDLGGQPRDVLARRKTAAPAPKRDAAGVADGPSTPHFARLRDLTNHLAELVDVTATRQGRLSRAKGGKVLGQFHRKTGVIRVRYQDDFDTFTHEVGHHVDEQLGKPLQALLKKHAAEVEKLAYPGTPKGRERSEGFAEFFRLYLTNPAYAAREAPGFDAAFRSFLGQHDAELAKALDDVHAAYRAWLDQPSQQAVASTIVSAKRPGWLGRLSQDMKKHGLGATIGDRIESAYGFLFDDLHPLQRATRALLDMHREKTGKAVDLQVTKDPYKLARMSRGAYTVGHMDVVHGVHAYGETGPSSASLRDAIIEAIGARNVLSKWDDAKVQAFGAYLWSRRAIGEWDRFTKGLIPNPPDKLTRGDHLTNIAELEAKNPTFASAAEKVYDWNTALWRKKRDAGLITDDQHAAGLEIVDYVPGLRAFDYAGDPAGKASGRRGGSTKGGLLKRFRGSRRDVVNPLDSLMADAYETAMAIARNDVVKALDRLAITAGPGSGAIAERIAAHELRATVVDPLEAIEAAGRAAGLDKMDITLMRDAVESAIGDQKAALFRPAIINEKGETIAFYRDAGELRALRLADGQFGKDMYTALTGMTRGEKSIFVEMLGKPAAVLRAGITTAPEFILANFFRDQAMASIFYGRPLMRLGATLSGSADEILGRDAARAYNAAGGIMGGAETAALRDAALERDITALRRKGWTAQRLTSVRGIAAVTELSETGMRLGLFKEFMKEAKARGLDDLEASLEAAWRARDHLDFDRRGWGLSALARMIPFLNASLQGLDKTARVMIAPFAKRVLGQVLTVEDERAMGQAVKAWARLGVLSTMGIGLHALMSRHEDYDEISPTTRATHWMVKAGDKWIAIPKPFELATVLNLGEAAYDAFAKQDPTAAGRYVDGLFQVVAPPSIIEGNPAIRSYFEIKSNTDFFTGNPIVPEHLKALEPWLQYTARTSELSKTLGEWFNVSPLIIDHLVTAQFGSWGRSALSMYDIAAGDRPSPGWDDMPFIRRFIKDASKGATSTTAFWDLVSEQNGSFEQAARSWRALMDAGDEARAADYLASRPTEERAYLTALSMPADVKRIHPLYRARLAVKAIGALRRDLVGGRLVNADDEPVEISRADAGAADDILSDLAMAEARNALVLLKVPGWANRTVVDTSTYHRELQAVSPGLYGLLADRYATASVLPRETVESSWPELRKRLLEDGSEAIVADLTASAKADGPELDGSKIRRRSAPAVPGVADD
ncbi:LPD38 domain-containing protein [Kaistia sp. MMO-174]|uniref:LPD38 domain-containing protein n=1 Tax=Kaistia sp. MMO-174 TaxID=3081256 RepID=UPI00301A2A9A